MSRSDFLVVKETAQFRLERLKAPRKERVGHIQEMGNQLVAEPQRGNWGAW